MRLDHYKKIGNNNIHLAAIIYNIVVIGALALAISMVLTVSLKRELKSIELFNISKNQRKREKIASQFGSEEELSLKRTKVTVQASEVAWKKL